MEAARAAVGAADAHLAQCKQDLEAVTAELSQLDDRIQQEAKGSPTEDSAAAALHLLQVAVGAFAAGQPLPEGWASQASHVMGASSPSAAPATQVSQLHSPVAAVAAQSMQWHQIVAVQLSAICVV